MQEKYKYDEIKSYFDEWIKEQPKEWILENKDDLHHHSFNTDYYIIGTYQATFLIVYNEKANRKIAIDY